MTALLDTSVLVAALSQDEPHHDVCLAQLKAPGNLLYSHGLLECFSTLTGGRSGVRVDTELAVRLLRDSILPHVTLIEVSGLEAVTALASARKHGVRGGAVYDYMHLVAARKAGADALYTLNLSDFLHLRREGDPQILLP